MKKQVLCLVAIALLCAGYAHADNTTPTSAMPATTAAAPGSMAPAAMAPSAMAPSAAAPATTMAPTSAMAPAASAAAMAPSPTATTATTTAGQTKPLSAQNVKMKDCATQYHAKGIAKSQYQSFMSQCLKSGSTTAPVTAATAAAPATAAMPVSTAGATTGKMSQMTKMKSCNATASSQSLTGDARKTFMSSCLSSSN